MQYRSLHQYKRQNSQRCGHLIAELREDSGLFERAVNAANAIHLVVACAEREQNLRVVGAHALLLTGR